MWTRIRDVIQTSRGQEVEFWLLSFDKQVVNFKEEKNGSM
jgi:hypothetical protein